MKGHLNDPQETAASFWKDGWLRWGDVGRFDERGYLFIVDRIKDLIIKGGENVYPREIEELLYQRAEVEACAVIGQPDPEWGERVVAFILPKLGPPVLPQEIKFFLRARLSPLKVPKEYIVVDDLPRSPTGKRFKREPRKRFLSSCKGQREPL